MHAQLLSHVRLFCDPTNYSQPGPSVHGIFQTRILEWVTISSSRGSSRPRDGTRISCISCTGRQARYHCNIWEDDFRDPHPPNISVELESVAQKGGGRGPGSPSDTALPPTLTWLLSLLLPSSLLRQFLPPAGTVPLAVPQVGSCPSSSSKIPSSPSLSLACLESDRLGSRSSCVTWGMMHTPTPMPHLLPPEWGNSSSPMG